MDPFRRTDCEGFYRRDFLKIGAAGVFGLTLPDLLRLEAASDFKGKHQKKKADSVILVWLGGGPSHLDMWDIKTGAPKEIRGEFQPINTSVKGLQISEHLPKMAKVMDKVTLVRSLYHTIPSHGTASIWMTTGNKPTPALQYPALGSLTAKLLPAAKGLPPYVTFGRSGNIGQAGYLGTSYNPFEVQGSPGKGKNSSYQVRGITLPTGFSLEELENRNRLLQGFDRKLRDLDRSADLVEGLDAFHRQALEILRSDKTKKAFNLGAEPPALRQRYGMTPFGQSALAARRLCEAGVRFVTISIGGWDTHGRNFDALKRRLLPALDQTLSALVEDLAGRGQLDRTVVYCAGEFGRTPKINKNAGRDHWARSMAVVLAGGGFKRGYVHGTTDTNGMAPTTEPCTPDDVAATIFHNLGLDPHKELMTSTGRPIQLFHDGKLVPKLLS